ncbi:uncharacterized protein Trissin isoform X2 [Epargyreus clarus]|uniref:uncharacterized protein Trissin isoform X2 n=1 Tax=Epargyreus clarus TaxID=520877 RepID=UPI003C2E52FE
MFKITAIVSLMFIGSTLWAASLSCDSCGSECASACGTRHFRSCCFNYLRKKRGQDGFKLWSQNLHDMNTDVQKSKMPFLEDLPEPWAFLSNDLKPYPYEDNVDNRLQLVYDV